MNIWDDREFQALSNDVFEYKKTRNIVCSFCFPGVCIDSTEIFLLRINAIDNSLGNKNESFVQMLASSTVHTGVSQRLF